ncbi:MAG: hypothetical protein ACPHFO_03005 [Acidimicrobiales bacterium]
MSPSLLLPALAVLIAVTALTLSLRTVGRELHQLRHALRRTAATAVAADDLSRSSAALRADTTQRANDARLRFSRRPQWWNQPAREPR